MTHRSYNYTLQKKKISNVSKKNKSSCEILQWGIGEKSDL